MQSLCLITVPCKPGAASESETLLDICKIMDAKKVHQFVIKKDLPMGTLDSLMKLSDDLQKVNNQVENITRKVERQYLDIKPPGESLLRVEGKPVADYMKSFQWNSALYNTNGKKLSSIVEDMLAKAVAIDEDLKRLVTDFTEKGMALAATERRKTINFATSDFEDILTIEKAATVETSDPADILTTVLVALNKSTEKEFERVYSTLGAEIAHYGAPERQWGQVGANDGKFGEKLDRSTVKGSPVVPGSHVKILETGESVLYSIVVLRGHYQAGEVTEDKVLPGKFVDYIEPLKVAFREKRFVLREFKYNVQKARSGGIEADIAEAKKQVEQSKLRLIDFAVSNFSELLASFVHLKAIKGFVESVLRYGIPFNVVAVLIEPDGKREKQNLQALSKRVIQKNPQLALKKALIDEEEEEDNTDNLPFICHKFSTIGIY